METKHRNAFLKISQQSKLFREPFRKCVPASYDVPGAELALHKHTVVEILTPLMYKVGKENGEFIKQGF